jgi:RNA processing factor Prp31
MIDTDLSEIIPEEIEEQVKEAAEISMGTEISEEDIINIQLLCDQVINKCILELSRKCSKMSISSLLREK